MTSWFSRSMNLMNLLAYWDRRYLPECYKVVLVDIYGIYIYVYVSSSRCIVVTMKSIQSNFIFYFIVHENACVYWDFFHYFGCKYCMGIKTATQWQSLLPFVSIKL